MVFKHQDIYLDITLQEDDLPDGSVGDPINFKLMEGCVVLVYQQKGKPLARFSKAIPFPNPDEYMAITDIDGENGEIQIMIPRRITKTMVSHSFFLEILAADELIGAEDDRFYTIASGIEVDLVADSVGKNIVIPE
jgi:hypothetical protein